jgi:hypothetical protein
MKQYDYGTSLNLDKIKIPGTKGKDYWTIKLKNKKFIANVPLNWKTAQFMNSCEYGNLNVNYCIGWKDDIHYWNKHVELEKQLPIYITNGRRKWVVMIQEGDKSYEVWDKLNQKVSKGNPEPIKDFSIKKELIQGKSSLYKKIRNDFFSNIKYSERELDSADDDYYNLRNYIENILTNFINEIRDFIYDYPKNLKEKVQEIDDDIDKADYVENEKLKDALIEFKEEFEYITHTDINDYVEEFQEEHNNLNHDFSDYLLDYNEILQDGIKNIDIGIKYYTDLLKVCGAILDVKYNTNKLDKEITKDIIEFMEEVHDDPMADRNYDEDFINIEIHEITYNILETNDIVSPKQSDVFYQE